jgi:preprotein translocase subunit SecD
MQTQSKLARALVSPLVMWVGVILAGSYYMFSLDQKALKLPHQPGLMATAQHYYNALKLNHIKKGIDLEGGTYLVLTVEIEKALENKLLNEARVLETALKAKGLAVATKKEFVDTGLNMSFATDGEAKAAYAALHEAKAASLRLKVTDDVLRVTFAPEVEQSVRTGAVEQGVNVLSNRLGGYGVEGIVVQQHGDHQIVIQLPGIDDPEHVKSVITKTAHLEFKIVEKMAGSREALLDQFDGELPSDMVIVSGRRNSEDDSSGQFFLVSAFPDVTGDHIVDAKVDHDEYNKPIVSFKFDSEGGREFGELTSNNIKRHLGIIIDDVMYTHPVISTAITGGSGIINGIASIKEAFDLSVVLKSGSLQAPLKVEHENRVGASLGQDSINKGILACVVALALLFAFSLVYYKIPGLFAIITLLVNIFLTLLFLSYFKATLTLPGIAGIVLTIGMAIDASILIYERVKDELRIGIPFKKAMLDGFSDAMPVILDSNITTFLTGLVLFWYGGPAIKGFAVTLMAGIVATLLSGVLFLKSMYKFFFDCTSVKQFKI